MPARVRFTSVPDHHLNERLPCCPVAIACNTTAYNRHKTRRRPASSIVRTSMFPIITARKYASVCACQPGHTLVKMNDYMPHVFSISKAPMHNAKQQNHHRTSHRLQRLEAPVFITCNTRTARHLVYQIQRANLER